MSRTLFEGRMMRAGRDEARELVNREERLLHHLDRLDLGADAEAVALDRADEVVGIARRGEDLARVLEVLLGIFLIVDIVKQADDAPVLGILAVLGGEVPHRASTESACLKR